jgi:hypothetical protein
MNLLTTRKSPLTAGLLLAAGLAFAAGPALAYNSVCVYLKVGAGYVSKFKIEYPDGTDSGWSNPIAIGQHACLDLPANKVPVGSKFSVHEHAEAGNTVTCKPSDVVQNDSPNPLTYFASGTTLNHHCETLR